MRIDELKAACGDGTGEVLLEIPRQPTGVGIRLTPRYGPIGRVICVKRNGKTVASFNAEAVLRCIAKQEGGGGDE